MAHDVYLLDEWKNGKNAITFWNPHRDLLLVTASGYFSKAFIPPFIANVDKFLQFATKPAIFGDWIGMERYDRECRSAVTEWVRAHRERITSLSVLVASPFAALGVNLANALLGNLMSVTADAAKFENQLRGTIVRLDLPLAARDEMHTLSPSNHGSFRISSHHLGAEAATIPS